MSASVGCLQFGPWEHGLCIAAGSADGKVTIIDYDLKKGVWEEPS